MQNAPKLQTLQRLFQQALNSEPSPKFLDIIESSGANVTLAPRKRVALYSYSYSARLIDLLISDFELTVKIIGKRKFRALAKAYLLKHPSRSPNIIDFGAEFPKFIADLRTGVPYLADAAKYDWAFIEGRDHLPVAKLKAPLHANAKTKISTAASLKLFSTRYPVQIWSIRKSIKPKTSYHAFFTTESGVQTLSIAKAQFELLSLISKHPQKLENLAAKLPEGIKPQEVSAWFSNWLSSGLIEKHC